MRLVQFSGLALADHNDCSIFNQFDKSPGILNGTASIAAHFVPLKSFEIHGRRLLPFVEMHNLILLAQNTHTQQETILC